MPRRRREDIYAEIERIKPRRKRGPGRPRKFDEGDLCWWPAQAFTVDGRPVEIRQYGLVVGRIPTKTGDGRKTKYAVIRTRRASPGSFTYGEVIVVKSWRLRKVKSQPFRKAAQRFWHNLRLQDRGCACNCCIHVAIAPGEILPDGRFRWEEA